jgi:Spy/CpxP family protein refolding chaperone
MKKAVISVIVATLTIASFAQQRTEKVTKRGQRIEKEIIIEDDNYFPGHRHARMENMLDLTSEQQTKVDALRIKHQKEMLAFRNQLREKKARLSTLKTTDPIDRKAIDNVIEEIGGIKVKMEKERMNMHLSIRELLTDEQKVLFDTHSSKYKRGKARGGNRGNRGNFGNHGNCGRRY